MTGQSDASTGQVNMPSDRWHRLPLALRTFLLCFTVAAVAGIGTVAVVWPRGEITDAEGISALSGVYSVVLIVALILGVVAARRGVRAWLAGYAGTALAGSPFAVAGELLALATIDEIAANFIGLVVAGVLVFASLAAIPFLLAGGLTAGAKWIARRA